MNNCEKLQRAFIEAQGYEIEDVINRSEFYATIDIDSDGCPRAGSIPGIVSVSDFKVTKPAPDPQRKRNFIMAALGEHSAGVTSPEEFVNLLMEKL